MNTVTLYTTVENFMNKKVILKYMQNPPRMLLPTILLLYCSFELSGLWKTMPGRVKQVPQDSTEWDRTDTGHSTDKIIYTCDIDIDSSSEPSSNKL